MTSALPPVYVISLPGSARRDAMRARLACWPGEWEFVDAVDGNALSSMELAAVYDEAAALRTCGRRLSRPEIGCALSHRRVYERVRDRRNACALVLEDDALFGPELKQFPFASLGASFDVVSLYTGAGLVRRRPSFRIAEVALHRAAGKVNHTVAYVVSDSGARKLLAATRTIRSSADWPVAPERLAFYVAQPFAVRHSEHGESFIQAGREAVRSEERRGERRWAGLLEGAAAYVTIPLFIKYFALRERYVDAADYCRREVAYNAKRMLPMLYSYLQDS